MARELILGVDVSTHRSKGVLCDASGRVAASVEVEHGMDVPRLRGTARPAREAARGARALPRSERAPRRWRAQSPRGRTDRLSAYLACCPPRERITDRKG